MVKKLLYLIICSIFSGEIFLEAGQSGIAVKYPYDKRIKNDKAVVFTEDFEEATLNDVAIRWNEVVNLEGMSLESDVPSVSAGTQSLQMTSIIGQNTGGHLYKRLNGYDTLYARFYVKFVPTCHTVHHFVWLGGHNPPTNWPWPRAGTRPVGNERFSTGIEPFTRDGWHWDFYTYWMHMRTNPGTKYWGNYFNPEPPASITRGEWICVEFMIKCNDPVTSYNGEQAFWVNGELKQHLGEGFPNGYWVWDHFHPDPDSAPFEGFQWRTVEELVVNYFWLEFYMTDGPNGQIDSVLFDDIVIATEYIGPIEPKIEEDKDLHVTGCKLQVYPNICRCTMHRAITISYQLPDLSKSVEFNVPTVSLKIYDLTGQLVKTLFDSELSTLNSQLSVAWDGRDSKGKEVTSGIYFCQLKAEEFIKTKRCIILK